MRSGRTSSGITLVELIVVTMLIALLGSVGYPTFQKFQAKARQVGGKTALAAIYRVERMGFLETGSYSPCLSQLGYAPETVSSGVARSFYTQGFGDDPAVDYPCEGPGGSYWTAGESMSGVAPAGVGDLPGSPVDASGFRAAAAGSISTQFSGYDVWTIDQSQNLVNETPGI